MFCVIYFDLSHCYSIACHSVILSFCLSVCKHSYGRNFDSILMKFCTVIRGSKSKIKFVWNKNLITPFFILPQFLKILHFGLWGLLSGITQSS